MKRLLLILVIVIALLPDGLKTMRVILMSGLILAWIIYVFSLVCYIRKRKKENIIKEDNLFIKDIPQLRTVCELSYLLNKKIDSQALGASIMDLVRKKALILKYNPENNDYIFVFNQEQNEKLTFAEKYLSDWLLTKIGNGQRIPLSLIKRDAYSNSAYFLACYNDWKVLASVEGTKPRFFEFTSDLLDNTIGYIILSIILGMFGLYSQVPVAIVVISLITTLVLILYVNSFYLRTKEGNSEYNRWMSFMSSIKNGEACLYPSGLPSLEKTIIYAAVLKVNPKKMIETIISKNLYDIHESDIIRYAEAGVIDEISQDINKCVSRATAISFVFSKNKGSKANVKYKRKEGN